MGVLSSFERRLQGAVQGTFTRLFGGSVHPSEVAEALHKEAELHLTRDNGRSVVPNRYIVRLGPSDAHEVGEDRPRAAAALTAMIRDHLAEQGWQTFGEVVVSLEESDTLHTGQFRISSLVDPDAGRPTNRRAGVPPMSQPHQDQPPSGAPDYPPPSGAQPVYQPPQGGPPAYAPSNGAQPGYPPPSGAQPTYQPAPGSHPAFPPSGAQPGYPGADQWGQPAGSGYPGPSQPGPSQPGQPPDQPAGQQPSAQYGTQYGPQYGSQYGQYPPAPPYGPPDPYAQPVPYGQQYGQPGQQYGPPAPESYAPSASPYGQPQPGYGPPAQDYGPPGYGQAAPDYGPQPYSAQQYQQPAPQQPAAPQFGQYGGYSAQAPADVQAVLVVEDDAARRYLLQRGSNIVGRGQEAGFRLPDTSVSRRHIDIYFDGQVAVMHDLGSTNGTSVNGSAVQTWQLADGDVIRVGHSTVVYRTQG